MNSEESIASTLISVSVQDIDLFEHIIIDSNSRDNTLNIVNEFENKYPLKYITEDDHGISDAFNKGVKMSSGDWLIFLGAGDELYNSDIMSEMKKELELRKKDLIVWGNIFYKDINGKKLFREKGNFPKKRLKRYMCLPHQAAFHNKELFNRYGLYNNNYQIAMDYDLCLRAINSINVNSYINKDISYMMIGGKSMDYKATLKEMLIVQKNNKVWKLQFVPYFLFIWGHVKYLFKKFIGYNTKLNQIKTQSKNENL